MILPASHHSVLDSAWPHVGILYTVHHHCLCFIHLSRWSTHSRHCVLGCHATVTYFLTCSAISEYIAVQDGLFYIAPLIFIVHCHACCRLCGRKMSVCPSHAGILSKRFVLTLQWGATALLSNYAGSISDTMQEPWRSLSRPSTL